MDLPSSMGETLPIGRLGWRATLKLSPTKLGKSPLSRLVVLLRSHKLSEEVFSRVHSKATAHEIWLEIDKIHNDSKKVCEEKYHVLNEKLNDFKMLPNELVEQMYSRLNVLVEDINTPEISLLSSSDVIRTILH